MLVRSLKPTLIESIPVLRTDASKDKPKVWVEAYGCSASMADSEMIKGMLKGAGYELATSETDRGMAVIVTCSVKDASEHRMLSRIRTLSKSDLPLVVAGCLPKADRARVEASSPSASLLGPAAIDRIVDVTRSTLSGLRQVALEDTGRHKVNVPKLRLNPSVSIVEIGSGCLSECTFCQTKLAKGTLRSYRIGEIVRQIRSDVQAGCSEVWLTSTDNGCYGRDIESDLAELLSACCDIPGDFKIRVGMMNPMYLPRMLDRLVGLFKANSKLFKFIHIPVESGSNEVLRRMKRGHTSEAFLEAARSFRNKIPEMTIATDIIVGFPGETNEDFESTIELISESEPDTVNISRYGARPGTVSAKWKKGRIGSQVAKRRSETLHTLARQIAQRRNSYWVDWEGEIIVDEQSKSGTFQGRNYAYKAVMLPVAGHDLRVGDHMRVKVYNFSSFSLRAKIIP